MKYLVIIALTGFMMIVVGCAQGAGNTPSGSTDLTTSAGRSSRTSENTACTQSREQGTST
jgi:hypothetical protein